MSTVFGVDLKFSAPGIDSKLRKLQSGMSGFDKAAQKAQGNSKKLERALGGVGSKGNKAANGIKRTGNAARRANKDVKGLSGSVGRLLKGFALLGTAKFIFAKTAELERTTKQLATVTGSLETAKGILGELQVINKQSPFSFIELADTAKRLSAFGIETGELVGTTERLGKAAAATGARVNELSLAYGQVAAKGKLQTEELYQFQERGIPLLDELAKGYGKTKGEVQDLISKGLVGFPAVEQAVKNLTTGNGKFAKSFENTADTLDAKLSNAIDSLGRAAAAFGELLKPTVIEALKSAEGLLTDITGFLKKIPQPAADAAIKFATFAAKAFLVGKAIKLLIGMKAGVMGMLTGTATNAALAGNASLTAAGKVKVLAGALRTLAAIGIVTVGVEYLVNGIRSGNRQEELLKGLESGAFENTLENMPYAQAQAALREEEKTLTGLLAKRDKLQKAFKDSAGLGAIPGVGPAILAAKKGELNEIEAQIMKSQRILSSKTKPKPAAVLEEKDDPFSLLDPKLDGNGKGNGKGTGAAPATDDLRALQGQVDLKRELMKLDGQIFKAEMAGDENLQRRLEGEKQLTELKYATADAIAGLNTEEGKRLQTTLSQLEATEIQANTVDDLAKIERDKTTAIKDALLPLQEQRQILEATLQGRGEEKRLQLEIDRILRDAPGLERSKVEELVKGNKEREKAIEKQNELKQLAGNISDTLENGIAAGLSTAIEGLVTGAEDLDKSLQKILNGVLKDIGSQLIKFGISSLFQSIGGGGAGGIFAGLFRAEGGPVKGGQSYIVGEEGPELFTPSTTGNISSNEDSKAMVGAMNRWSPANAQSGGAGGAGGGGEGAGEAINPVINISTGPTLQFEGKGYVSQADFQQGLAKSAMDGAKMGEARALRKLQMSSATRKRLGM